MDFIGAAHALALGPLALRPAEFWLITPFELDAMAKGYRFREKRAWEKAAWITAHIVSTLAGKAVQPSELIHFLDDDGKDGHSPSTIDKPKTMDEAKKMIDEMEEIQSCASSIKRQRWPELFNKDAEACAVKAFIGKPEN